MLEIRESMKLHPYKKKLVTMRGTIYNVSRHESRKPNPYGEKLIMIESTR